MYTFVLDFFTAYCIQTRRMDPVFHDLPPIAVWPDPTLLSSSRQTLNTHPVIPRIALAASYD